MGCLFAVFALITPRFVVFVLWLFTHYLATAYGSWFWPTLGFFVAPTTTLAYAVARNDLSTASGSITAAGTLIREALRAVARGTDRTEAPRCPH